MVKKGVSETPDSSGQAQRPELLPNLRLALDLLI